MRFIERRLAPPLALAIFVTALLTTACPTSNDLDRAAKASNELAHDVLLANRAVAEFYKAGKIPLAAKDKIADKLAVIGDKGEKFNNILIEMDKKYPQGTLPPQDAQFVRDNLAQLRALYTDIVADLLPFKAQSAVGELNKDLTTIEKVVK
jgi:hypothetical protein